ncbi:hypothetical protein EG328_004362 [Venturia inaequalis]|uniref:Uncharacterized protein n=1 Tax=Venturia inaequalis TaxID=5025 RepID=A0A8H3Z5M7_VENIN|nr:hypothetical protein EG328_004362 [Venturia inaequalis]
MAAPSRRSKKEGTENIVVGNNWGLTQSKLAAAFGHHCTYFGCGKKGDLQSCFGRKHHLMLCDVCGYVCRSNEGCDKCEDSPAPINMLMMSKLATNNIDVEWSWRLYIQAVNKDDHYTALYPGLRYNEATWDQDLNDHIIARRRQHWDGMETRERGNAEEAAKAVSKLAETAARERTDLQNNKGKGAKARTETGKIAVSR